MGSLFQFNEEEILTFFAVLVRYSTLVALLPLFGDRFIPTPVKVLLSLAITVALYPGLVKTGLVRPYEATIWSKTAGGIILTIGSEAFVGVTIGFVAKLFFDAISMGANFIGSQMGFSMATIYDPHHEAHTNVVAELHVALATLAFLALDGHSLILKAALESYQIVGLGQVSMTATTTARLIEMASEMLKFAVQLSAPIVIVMFIVNVVFGIFSRTMPQMNILVLSFAITSLVGLFVLFIGLPEFMNASVEIMAKSEEWMTGILYSMRGGS